MANDDAHDYRRGSFTEAERIEAIDTLMQKVRGLPQLQGLVLTVLTDADWQAYCDRHYAVEAR